MGKEMCGTFHGFMVWVWFWWQEFDRCVWYVKEGCCFALVSLDLVFQSLLAVSIRQSDVVQAKHDALNQQATIELHLHVRQN